MIDHWIIQTDIIQSIDHILLRQSRKTMAIVMRKIDKIWVLTMSIII